MSRASELRAVDLIESAGEGVVRPAGFNRFEVSSRRDRSKRYVVTCPHLDAAAQLWSCSCPHFRYRVGRGARPDSACKHIHAVLLWLRLSSPGRRRPSVVLFGPASPAPVGRGPPQASVLAGVASPPPPTSSPAG